MTLVVKLKDVGLIEMIKPIDIKEAQAIYDKYDRGQEDTLPPVKGASYWGYYEDNKLVGTIGLVEKKFYSKIVRQFVIKEYRKKKIGLKLFKFVLDKARTPKIISFATHSSIEFYVKEGFTITKKYSRTFRVEINLKEVSSNG